MPLVRYFLVAGSALLVLLFISNAYLPKSEIVASSNPDAPIIRIHSDRKAPELVVYDTNHPPVVAEQVAQAAIVPPARVADNSGKTRILDAFAQLQPSNVKTADLKASSVNLSRTKLGATTGDLKMPPQPQPKRKVAKTHIGPPTVLVAQRQQFGYFANDTW